MYNVETNNMGRIAHRKYCKQEKDRCNSCGETDITNCQSGAAVALYENDGSRSHVVGFGYSMFWIWGSRKWMVSSKSWLNYIFFTVANMQ